MSSPAESHSLSSAFWMAALLPEDAVEFMPRAALAAALRIYSSASSCEGHTLAHFLRQDDEEDARASYFFFRQMRMALGAPALPRDALDIGSSLWTTILFEEQIELADDFHEAVASSLPLKTVLSLQSLFLDAIADPNKINRHAMGHAAAVIFCAEARLYPDTVRAGLPFMPAWGQRLAQQALAMAENDLISVALSRSSNSASAKPGPRL